MAHEVAVTLHTAYHSSLVRTKDEGASSDASIISAARLNKLKALERSDLHSAWLKAKINEIQKTRDVD